jgi:hypothetical protein
MVRCLHLRKKHHLSCWAFVTAWILGLCLISIQAQAFRESPKKVTICELAKHPKHYNRKLVEVFAYYESDRIRPKGITDPSCPDVRVSLVLDLASEGKPALAQALAKGQRGTGDKTISGTFEGRLTWRPNEQISIWIWVIKMEGLTVSPKRVGISSAAGGHISTNETSLLADNLPEKTTVCEIIKNKEQYDGRRVRISGYIESDAMHATLFEDSLCPQVGISIGPSITDKGMEELQSAIWKGFPGTGDKTITATVEGIFLWEPDSHPTMELVIEEIQNMKVGPKSPDDPWQPEEISSGKEE